ncbi:hypothetical protein vBRpoPV14_12 [Ruegeria phage vB_RpoP-V14]|uniref:Uncharacterized protein n=4 Tax=Aorunvirus V12 TaxID=2846074 RepID=A0A2Z4QFY9_9CAUD|nr:hypothetical protein HYP62_gp11 [Ruegeria phage vB_RpoP-V12]AWY08798.1 hypothetical protein vBRpoPV12_11 [Ruegeria phage vB_RpoP-V12]AWY08969.1 hypothetical protein vBRpoPV21_11 [Ruegeria phage vB_RpoP-V21]AWY09530.1 hypothetical protein vBRpoPV17_11 [Ruegeria phage vB_RpoP-V17]AXF42130.1 hypothetical protein vBRpoPV14_12 [Ruegeria phage vB_RpoP-V14]
MILIGIFMIMLNWILKLLVGLASYHLMMWFGAPEWAVITVVAVAAASTSINFEINRR